MASVKIIGKVAVKVMPDTSDFKKKLEQELNDIERQIGDLKVDVVPQITKAAKDAVKAEFAKLKQDLEGKKVNIDLGLKNGDIATIETALDALTRNRKVKVEVDYDADSALRSMADGLLMLGGARPQLDALAEGFEKLRNIDYIAINTGVMAAKVTLLGGAALAATGHVFSLGSDLASISRIGFALPGILGGIVIGLGTTAAAFKDFNEYVPQAKDYMSQLQDTISSNFWEQAAGQINAFVDGVFPVLNKNLGDTATVLGTFWGSLAESAGTNLNPALKGMFTDLNESIVIATGSVDSIVNIIKVLGETGAGYLPALAQWFTQITDQFSNFLTRAQGDGTLKTWIDEGITNLQALGGVLKSTFDIFSGIASAAQAAGGASLVGLADGLKGIASVVNSPAFQTGLTEVFITAMGMMNAITTVAGPGLKAMILQIADVFNTVGPGLAVGIGAALGALGQALASPEVKDGAIALFDGMSNAMKNIIPAIGPIVSMIASLGPVFGALLTQISAIAAAGTDRLAPTFTKIADASVPVIEKLGGLFQSVFESLTPVFQQAGENVAKLVTAFGPLIDAVQNLWNKVAPLLVPVLKIVVQILGDMLMGVVKGITMVFQGLAKIVGGVIDVFKGIGDVIAGIFTGDFSRIGDGFKQIFSGLGDIVMGALEAVAGAFWAWINGSFFAIFRKAGTFLLGKVTGMFGKVWGAIPEGLTTAFQYVRTGAEGGVTMLSGIFGRILEVLTYPFVRFGEIVGPFLSAGWAIVKGIFTAAFEVIKAIIMVQWTVISTIFTTAFNIIKTIVLGAWTAISGLFTIAFTTIKAVVTAAWGGIVAWFQTSLDALYFLFKGPWDSIAEFLLGLWTSIKAGAMLVWDGLRAWFDEVLLKMSIRFEDAWNAIKGAVESVWGAIKGFFTSTWEAISNLFTSKGNAIKEFLGNVWDGIKTVIHTVWDGIKTWIGNKWDLIKADAEIVFTAIKNKLGDIWDAVKSKVTEIWNGIETKISGVWTTIKTTVSEAIGKVKSTLDDAWTTIKTAVGDAWDAVKTTVETKITEVKTKVAELPGKAKEALGDLANTLVASGASLLQGFIDGITSKVQSAKDAVSGALSSIRNLFPFSPAKEGPFSGTGYTTYSGRALMGDFAKGIESQQKTVMSAVLSTTQQVSDAIDSVNGDYKIGIATHLDTSGANMSAIGGLSASVGSAVSVGSAATTDGSVHIDNITIPLEDLQQLKSLEEFLDMLRVRTRQGVL